MGGGVGNSTPEVHKLSPGDNFVIPRSAPLAPAVPAWAREDDEPEVFRIPKGDPKRYDLFPRLEGDYLVWSDPHAPFHDDEFMTLSIKKAHRLGIQDLIIAGDLMDGNQFSKRGLHIGHQRRWQDDAEIGAAIVRVLSAAFRRVTILMGNHDDWFTKYFRGHADAEWLYSRLFNTAGNVEWTHFQQCEVKSGGKTFRVLHGANYSGRNPLTVGKDLAAKFGCGIVMGHQHHHESGFDKSGDHQVVCMGGMYDPSKLAYIHESPRTNPVPTPGYAIIKDGWVQDYAKRKAPEW